jgi:hypothetical protein
MQCLDPQQMACAVGQTVERHINPRRAIGALIDDFMRCLSIKQIK